MMGRLVWPKSGFDNKVTRRDSCKYWVKLVFSYIKYILYSSVHSTRKMTKNTGYFSHVTDMQSTI